jgi:ABC transport system ATP-binding/permease protein
MGQVEPDRGTVRRADNLQVAYFEQTRETLNPELSVLKNICPEGDYVFCQGTHIHVRSYLDRFLFRGQMSELPVRKLSGGEQARLRLAQLMLTSCQVLILDEPTNDLDADTLNLLEESLRDFKGAVILVTHDRYFMDAVASSILAFPPTLESPPVLERFASYFQWEEWRAKELARVKTKAKAEAKEAASPKKSRLSYKEKFELENMEAAIMKLEEQIAALTAESQSPEMARDHKRLNEVLSKLAGLQTELDAKYQRWTDLEARQ